MATYALCSSLPYENDRMLLYSIKKYFKKWTQNCNSIYGLEENKIYDKELIKALSVELTGSMHFERAREDPFVIFFSEM